MYKVKKVKKGSKANKIRLHEALLECAGYKRIVPLSTFYYRFTTVL